MCSLTKLRETTPIPTKPHQKFFLPSTPLPLPSDLCPLPSALGLRVRCRWSVRRSVPPAPATIRVGLPPAPASSRMKNSNPGLPGVAGRCRDRNDIFRRRRSSSIRLTMLPNQAKSNQVTRNQGNVPPLHHSINCTWPNT